MVSEKAAFPRTAADILAGSPYGFRQVLTRSTGKDELVGAMPFRPNRLERAVISCTNLITFEVHYDR
jgi:hypothetical protein